MGALTRLIRAELIGSNECRALGVAAKSDSPVVALCRQLIKAGYDPAIPLEAYRGDTPVLRVKSIGQGAALRVTPDTTGRPVFKRPETRAGASLVRSFQEAAE
jgi:hypothetical protein